MSQPSAHQPHLQPGNPERHLRNALFAVELIDPVSLERISRRVRLVAHGLSGPARISYSGRFIWQMEGDNWPASFEFDPYSLPYDAQTWVLQPKPGAFARTDPAERLIRLILRPNVAYPFPDGLTVVRGRLREQVAIDAPAVSGAQVWLAWWNGHTEVHASHQAVSNRAGAFACFLRLPVSARPLLTNDGKLDLRLVVQRGTERREQVLAVADGQIHDVPDALVWGTP